MGKSKLIRYIIRRVRTGQTIAAYDAQYAGKPTTENLSKWRDKFNKSLKKGGCNEHLGINWLQCNLEIYDQLNKTVVCSYNAPMFGIIND